MTMVTLYSRDWVSDSDETSFVLIYIPLAGSINTISS